MNTHKTDALPRHVAIIMDGNGRWARDQGLRRFFGHREGAKVVREITREAARLGLAELTLFSFSTENWKRPPIEVRYLMKLLADYLVEERREIQENNIRFRAIGRLDRLPESVQGPLRETTAASAGNTGMILRLALNYGARQEMADAARALAEAVARGEVSPGSIHEETLREYCYDPSMSDPDLLIRTAGEQRLSNFLLWHVSYSEIWITQTLWPEFGTAEFHRALADYALRERKFGAVPTRE